MPRMDDEDIRAQLEGLTREALDLLPFGVIRIDEASNVVLFSATEARQSGFGDRRAIGRAFFTELAPCFWSREFQDRIERAMASRTLDATFDRVGDYGDATRELRVRMLSASTGGAWVLIERIG